MEALASLVQRRFGAPPRTVLDAATDARCGYCARRACEKLASEPGTALGEHLFAFLVNNRRRDQPRSTSKTRLTGCPAAAFETFPAWLTGNLREAQEPISTRARRQSPRQGNDDPSTRSGHGRWALVTDPGWTHLSFHTWIAIDRVSSHADRAATPDCQDAAACVRV